MSNEKQPILSDSEREQIKEILDRRRNELASFRSDLERSLSENSGTKIRIYDMPGSVELAIDRELRRLERLKLKIAPIKEEENEE